MGDMWIFNEYLNIAIKTWWKNEYLFFDINLYNQLLNDANIVKTISII